MNNSVINDENILSDELLFPFGKEKNSILKIIIDKVIVKGSGVNIREAYSRAFDDMKKIIYQKFNNFIIHLEPLDVVETSDESNLKTKRVMGLFPHKKMTYDVELSVTVRVKYLDI